MRAKKRKPRSSFFVFHTRRFHSKRSSCDWRARPKGVLRLLFGNGFVTQVAIAAEKKAMGRNPPPANATWKLVRRQAWVVLGSIGVVLGIAGTLQTFYRDPDLAKWFDPKAAADFAAAKAARSCNELRAFAVTHNGSAWSSEASELLITCKERGITVDRPVETYQDFVVGTGDAIARASEEEAYKDAIARGDAKGREKCTRYAANVGAQVLAVELDSIKDRQCGTARDGVLCTFMATAKCSLMQRMSDTKETMGGDAP